MGRQALTTAMHVSTIDHRAPYESFPVSRSTFSAAHFKPWYTKLTGAVNNGDGAYVGYTYNTDNADTTQCLLVK